MMSETTEAKSVQSHASSNQSDEIIVLLIWIANLFLPLVAPIIFLFVERNKKEIKFQSWLALLVNIACAIAGVIWLILTVVGSIVTLGIGMVFFTCITPFLILVPIILNIVGAIKAYRKEEWNIPYLTEWSHLLAKRY